MRWLPNFTTSKFCMILEMPSVVTSAAIGTDFFLRSGINAALSIKTPKSPVMITAMTIAGTGPKRSPTKKNAT